MGRCDLQGSFNQPCFYASGLGVAFGEFQRTSRFRRHEENVQERLRDHFDYIIVDLSPLVPIVDVRSALSFVDAYVLMIEWGTTAIETVERAVHSAKAVSDKVIGVVLNKVDFKALGRFDGEGYYYKKKVYARYGYVE